jgi:hypothetical protein
MSAMTMRVHPTVEPWLRGELTYLQRSCPTLTFADLAPGVLCVVAIYPELVRVMNIVEGHTGIFVFDYESHMREAP